MLTAVISIPVADHMLQEASRMLTMRPMPNFVVGPWTSVWSHVAMSVTASDLTAVISIPVADHMLQEASRMLTMRPMPNFVVGPWTSVWSHVAMSVTASGGNTPCMAV